MLTLDQEDIAVMLYVLGCDGSLTVASLVNCGKV